MQENGSSFLPITEADLLPHAKRAETDLNGVEWRPKKIAKPGVSMPIIMGPSISGDSALERASVIEQAKQFSDGGVILSDSTHHVLSVWKKALEIAAHVEMMYMKASGLETLESQNKAKTLPPAQLPEFNGKQTTRAAIQLWVAASYVVWELAGYRVDEVSSVAMDMPTIVECPLSNAIQARKCMLFYLGRGLAGDLVNNDLAFIKYALLYSRALLAELKLREPQFKFAEPFIERKYKLENSEFSVLGFKELGDRSVVSVEFNKVLFTQMVGNKRAKHDSKRTISRLLCYDQSVMKNFMRELGGLASIRLGWGEPGTGKSMLIAAIATELEERSKWIGIPFLFHPLPDAIVSTYQGGSAERMVAWMTALKDPTKLIYAPIDDAENSFENRTRQGVSAGVREVINTFLRNTEGAYAVNHGNTLIDVCTNLPEQVDPAVMSRIVARFPIKGAESENDFIDQDRAWWKQYSDYSKDFINMEDPRNYAYFSDQKPMVSVSKDGERYAVATNSAVADILKKTQKDFDPRNQRFFGALYRNVKEIFPGFTSRDVRNIQSAVTNRILDFDFPAEWLDDPTRFFHLVYDEKKGMVIELMRENMKGVSFREMRMEEVLRYLDGMASIANVDFERQVNRAVETIRVQQEATRRYKLSLLGSKQPQEI